MKTPFFEFNEDGRANSRISELIAIALLLVSSSSDATEFEKNVYIMPERCDSVVVLDIDGDGDRDLVGVCRTSAVAIVLPEGGLRTLWQSEDGGAIIHACCWDADGDGDNDIAVGRFTRGEKWSAGWLENPSWKMHPLTNELDGIHGVAVGHLNGDGREDLVAAIVKTPPESVGWFDGETKTLRFLDRAEAGERPHYMAIGDLDGDSKNDVLLGDGGGFCIYRNPGPVALDREWERTEIARVKGGTNVTLADIDSDGDLEIIGARGHGTGVTWYENPEWSAYHIDSQMSDVHALDSGDLDGDGDIDVAYASFGGYAKPNEHRKQVYWAENDGSGGFTSHEVDIDSAQESYALIITDVDGNRRNDIVLAGRGSESVVWCRNH